MSRDAGAGAGPARIALHSCNVRICHWINVVAGAYLVLSGIHIFLDFPELYWGHTGYRGYPAWFRLSDWGLSWDEAAELGDRMWGRNYHFTFAWVFLLNGVVYVVWNIWTGHLRLRLLPGRAQLGRGRLAGEIREMFRWRTPARLAATRYGALQGSTYLLLVLVYAPLMTLTGLAQSPGFTAAMPWLLDMFGGRQTARTLHTLGAVAFVLFVAAHVAQVAAAGMVNRVRAMITGTFRSPQEGR